MKDIDSLPLAAPLRIAVVYQDAITQSWAVQLCDRARGQIAAGEIKWADWRLDLMSEPGIFDQALAAGLKANLLVIAAYAHTILPRDIKRWLETCLTAGRTGDSALVGLLGRQAFARDCFPAREYLAATAESSGVRYFLREFTLHTEMPELTLDSIDRRAHTTTALLSDMLRRTDRARDSVHGKERLEPARAIR